MSAPAAIAEQPTRDRVLALAAGLFADRGFAAVSMRDIAQAAGIRAASLYNHFADKEALYLAVLEQVFAARVRLVEAALTATGAPRERLRAMVAALVRATAGDPVAARLLQRELLDGDRRRIERLARDLFRTPFERIEALLLELAPAADAAPLAAYLIALVHGYSAMAPLLPALDERLPPPAAGFSAALADELIARLERERP
jgi:TetR/AcrR family transcriptional regulator